MVYLLKMVIFPYFPIFSQIFPYFPMEIKLQIQDFIPVAKLVRGFQRTGGIEGQPEKSGKTRMDGGDT